MPENICKNCEFYLKGNYPDDGQGFCRRFPPMVMEHSLTHDDVSEHSAYPQVGFDDWCGEFWPRGLHR